MVWGVLAILVLFLGGYALGALSLAPWVPTRKKDYIRINRLSGIDNNTNFMELGCGSGSLLFYLARKNPAANFYGVEISWFLYLIARIRQIFFHQANVHIYFGNLFNYNLASYSIIYVFGLHRSASVRLAEKIYQDTRPGTRIITYTFPLPNWPPMLVDKKDSKDLSIYIYEVKGKVTKK